MMVSDENVVHLIWGYSSQKKPFSICLVDSPQSIRNTVSSFLYATELPELPEPRCVISRGTIPTSVSRSMNESV